MANGILSLGLTGCSCDAAVCSVVMSGCDVVVMADCDDVMLGCDVFSVLHSTFPE